MEERKIAVVGERESILAFQALGLQTAECETVEEAVERLNEFASGDVGVIFLTESIAEKMGDHLVEWRLRYLPIVVIIPSAKSEPYLGRRELRTAIRKATGIDLIGQQEKSRREDS